METFIQFRKDRCSDDALPFFYVEKFQEDYGRALSIHKVDDSSDMYNVYFISNEDVDSHYAHGRYEELFDLVDQNLFDRFKLNISELVRKYSVEEYSKMYSDELAKYIETI